MHKNTEQLLAELSARAHAFLVDIGVNESVRLVSEPSGLRRQTVSAELVGLRWVFWSERGHDGLLWRNEAYPEIEISWDEIGDYFHDPDDEEIGRRATSALSLLWRRPPETIARAAPFVRAHLNEIRTAISSDKVLEVHSALRRVKERLFAVQRRLGRNDPSAT